MIAIVDYGMGNLRSVEKAFQKLGHQALVSSDEGAIKAAQAVVLPGVGAFADCMGGLAGSGLRDVVLESVESKPFLGICVGYQLLFSESTEDGTHEGLAVFPGKVLRLPAGRKIPHMGWNQVRRVKDSPLLEGVPDGSDFYFVHSYYVVPEDERLVLTTTDYDFEFASSIGKGNVFACQFHPEKSGSVGLKMLDNFARLSQ